MEKLLRAILNQWRDVETMKTNILNNFHKFNTQETIDYQHRLLTNIVVLQKLQAITFDMFEPMFMTTIINNGKYQYGENHYEYIEITAEQAFGKPFCNAEEWLKNPKLQALYPNKYIK